MRRAGSLHAGSGYLGRGGLGELVVKGAELRDSGMQYREGAGLNGERPGKGGVAGSGRNGKALGASLLGACRRWSLEVPFVAVKVVPNPPSRVLCICTAEAAGGKSRVSGDALTCGGSRWHSLIATRPVPPTQLSTCLRQLPVRPLEDWTTEGSLPFLGWPTMPMPH